MTVMETSAAASGLKNARNGEDAVTDCAGSMAPDTVEVRLPAQERYTAVARQTVESVCGELHMSDNDRAAVRLAVGEACNNAVLHAVPLSSSAQSCATPTVTVLCRICDDALEIEVTNEGNGVLPKVGAKMPDPLSESGRGVALIEMMMDAVQYVSHNGNTTLWMRKNRTPAFVPAVSGVA